MRSHVARIHPVVQLVDGLALAGAFDAGDEDQRRKAAVLLKVILRFKQPLAESRLLALVDAFRYLVVEIRRLEHRRIME